MAKRWDPAKAKPAKPGDRIALKSGARSERSVEPVRAQLAVKFQDIFPTLSEPELIVLADRMARAHLVQVWLDANGVWADEKKGVLQPCIAEMEKWLGRAESIMHIARLEAEGQKPVFDLDAIANG